MQNVDGEVTFNFAKNRQSSSSEEQIDTSDDVLDVEGNLLDIAGNSSRDQPMGERRQSRVERPECECH